MKRLISFFLLTMILIFRVAQASDVPQNLCEKSDWDGLYHLQFQDFNQKEFEQGFESEVECNKARRILFDGKFPNAFCGCNSKFNPLMIFTTNLSSISAQLTCYKINAQGEIKSSVIQEFKNYVHNKTKIRRCVDYKAKMMTRSAN